MAKATTGSGRAWVAGSVLLALVVAKHWLGITVSAGAVAASCGPASFRLDLVDVGAAVAVLAYMAHELWLEQRARYATITRELGEVGRMRKVERDPLTGLSNQRAFDAVAAERLARGENLAVLLLDLHDFDSINDQYGYSFGDALLLQIGDRLRTVVYDAKSVAHLFSDEFGILAPSHPSVEDVHGVALHLLRTLDAPFTHGGVSVRVSANIGIAQAPQHGGDVAGLMQAATHALRAAKEAGRGVWRVYDPAMRDTASVLRKALPAAIARGEIVPYYQPIVDLTTSRVAGLEVLARWNHPSRGLLLPRLFVDLAEAEGQLSELTLSLLRQVVQDAAAWPDTLFLAFNVAPSQLRDVDSFVLAQTDEPALPPHRVEVELTEQELIRDLDATREVVRELRSRGTRVALDDFGAGHGNFYHLRNIPFDRLKIDKEFVLDMVNDSRAEVCVQSIVEAAQRLGIDVTAEGVSTPEIAARVAALGCRFVQGSLFSMPVPAEEVGALLVRLGTVAAASERRLVPAEG